MQAILDSHAKLKTVRLATALALVLASGWGAPAVAQQTYPPEVEDQCRGDYFKHCSPYALGSTELRRCMESQGKQLSPNCRQALRDAGFVRSGTNRR